MNTETVDPSRRVRGLLDRAALERLATHCGRAGDETAIERLKAVFSQLAAILGGVADEQGDALVTDDRRTLPSDDTEALAAVILLDEQTAPERERRLRIQALAKRVRKAVEAIDALSPAARGDLSEQYARDEMAADFAAVRRLLVACERATPPSLGGRPSENDTLTFVCGKLLPIYADLSGTEPTFNYHPRNNFPFRTDATRFLSAGLRALFPAVTVPQMAQAMRAAIAFHARHLRKP